ncbi:ABC transporter substrate-binding protein [Leifsonia sp. NPDC058230]|uniref:ABC transporter substrate-binding protein n=1 Tax=Leifsonia sp. NPDC058230 TaxID=3346391 RepID=UPI0036DD7B7B
MHRTVKRGATVLAAIALAAAALTGCSSSAPAADAPVSLTWWGWNAFNKDQVIKDFQAANPKIKVTYKQYAYNDYVTALRPGLSSNKGPDVFQVQPGDLVTNFGPLAVPVEDRVAKDLGDDWASKFNQEGLSQLQFEKKQVALPAYMSAAGLIYYNKKILDQYGLSVPTDFAEWKTVCETLKANNVGCLAHGAKDAWVNTDVFLALINSIAPGKVYDAIDGKTSWTDPEFVKAMDAWSELFTSGIIGSGATAATEYPDAQTTFMEDKAAFIALGTWNTPATMTKTGQVDAQKTVTKKIDGLFLSAPFPAPVTGDDPTKLFGGPDNGFAVSAKSSKQDAAFKFLEFLTAGGGQKIQAAGGNIPAITSVKVATTDVIDPSQVADIEGQQEALADLVGARQIPYSDLTTALGDALSAVAAGTSSPADALKQVESASKSVSR